MSRKNNEISVGIAVFAGSLVIVILVFLFGKQSFTSMSDAYPIIVKFEKAPGIGKNSPVFKSGIKIGYVESSNLVDDENQSVAEVKVMIYKNRTIYTNEECRIHSALMSGDSNLEFTRMRKFDGAVVPLNPGEEIRGVVPPDLMQSFGSIEGDLSTAINNISTAAEKMGDFIETLNSALGTPEELEVKQERFQKMISETAETLGVVNQLAKNVDALVSDKELSENLRQISKEMPLALARMQTSLEKFDGFTTEAKTTFNGATKALDKLSTNMDHLEDFSEALGEQGPEIIRSVAAASRKLTGMFNDISSLMEALQNPEGSLGQLLNNPELYNSVQETIHNVEQITVQMKPIVDDFRIFSDKISRDPSVLGVRGAIERNTPIKGSHRSVRYDAAYSRNHSPGFGGSGGGSANLFSDEIPAGNYGQYPAVYTVPSTTRNRSLFGGDGLIGSNWESETGDMLPRKTVVQRALESAAQRKMMQSQMMSGSEPQVRFHDLPVHFQQPQYESGDWEYPAAPGCGTQFPYGDTIYGESTVMNPGEIYERSPGEMDDLFSDEFSGTREGFLQPPHSGSLLDGLDQRWDLPGEVSVSGNAQGTFVPPHPQSGTGRAVPRPQYSREGVPGGQIGTVPALGRSATSSEPEVSSLPITILDFSSHEEAPHEEQSGGYTLPDEGAYIIPKRHRGYIIEYDTGLPPVQRESLARSASQEKPLENPETKETRNAPQLSFEPLQQPAQSEAAQPPKVVSNPPPRTDKTEPRKPEPQFGSVRPLHRR